jgi:predicted acyl esterase
MRPTLLSVLAAAVAVLGLAGFAQADAPPPGSTWSQATITEPDGTRLHADVLRPSNLPADAKTPVIVSVGRTSTIPGRPGRPALSRARPMTRPVPRARPRASTTSSTART